MSGEHMDIDKHVRTYVLVFAGLMVLTLVTVAISYLELPLGPAVALALFVAIVKGSLVACFFMHLIDERKLVYWVLGFTVFFFFCCLLGPWLSEINEIGPDLLN